MFNFVLLLLILLTAGEGFSYSLYRQCPSNLIEARCGPSCDLYCDSPHRNCHKTCTFIPRCFCPKGEVLLSKRMKICVPIYRCPGKCKHGQIYKECVSSCTPTCDDPNPVCTKECDRNKTCQCPPGTLQKSSSDPTCVKIYKCSLILQRKRIKEAKRLQHTCTNGQVATNCGMPCTPTCDNPTPFCSKMCDKRKRCQCPPGTIQHSLTNTTCVLLQQCGTFKEVDKKTKCPSNQEFTDCASRCPATCDDRSPRCTRDCDRNNHCQCPRDMVLRSADDEECVFVDECAAIVTTPACPGKMIQTNCASMCPPTCDDPRPLKCVFSCNPEKSCVCPPGFLEHEGQCLLQEECPVKEPMCSDGMIATSCASMCPATCNNPTPGICIAMCNLEKKCECPSGLLEHEGSCINQEKCPKKECRGKMIRTDCASMCPPTCDDPKPDTCVLSCNPDKSCVCPPGLLEFEGECIQHHDCPKKKTCPADKIPTNCASRCPATCDEPNPVCTFDCDLSNGCECPADMVQFSKTNDTCIHILSCPAKCEFGQVPTDCATSCPATCEDPFPICTRDCVPGIFCQCPHGTVQRSLMDKQCITQKECAPSGLVQDCPFNQVPTNCASRCPSICGAPLAMCSSDCDFTKSCECPFGTYMASATNGTCISREECQIANRPNTIILTALHAIQCPSNQEFTDCASRCPATCDDRSPPCTRDCDRNNHCQCPRDMVLRSADDEECVFVDECASIVTTPACPGKMVPTECASMCPATCDDPEPLFCVFMCNLEKPCVCPPGLLEHEGECIEQDDCPVNDTQECPKDMVATDCATTCPLTCEHPNPRPCTRNCDVDKRCVCPPGLLEHEGRCIEENECPSILLSLTPKCGPDKIRTFCATMCPLTCENPKPRPCIRMCDPDKHCICRPGLVEHNDQCVEESDCPIIN